MTLESPPPLPNENDAEEGPNDVEMATTDASELEIGPPNERSPRDETDAGIPSKDEYQKTSTLREREFETPKQLSEREASKALLAQERSELAQQIRAERIENRNNIARLTVELEALRYEHSMTSEDVAQRQQKLQELMAHRAEYATTFAGRIRKLGENMGLSTYLSELDENVATEEENMKLAEERATALAEEKETLEQLITSDRVARSIQEWLSEHYTRAGEVSQAEYERQQRTVEQVTMRNNAFILHALATVSREWRPHSNSPVNQDATLEDEMDILISLEPAISTSSVRQNSPEVRLFWDRQYGVILGGGDVESARGADATNPKGIKDRPAMGNRPSSNTIDAEVQRVSDSYNEIVVNNARVSGVFHKVSATPSREGVPTLLYVVDIDSFKKAMDIAHVRGMPQYVLTPDNRMFAYISVEDETGCVEVGNEVHPADIARGGAGFTDEKRLEAGTRVLDNKVLKRVDDHLEAKKILGEISGETTELTMGEYMDHMRKFPQEAWERLRSYPREVASNPSVIQEAIKLDPVHAFENIATNRHLNDLLNDKELIKSLYDNLPPGTRYEYLYRIPSDILDKDIVLHALEHGDTGDNIPEQLFNDPEIKRKIIDNVVAKYNVEPFEREDVVHPIPNIIVNYGSEQRRTNLTDGSNLISLLNDRFAGQYTFERYSLDERMFLVTKVPREG